MNNIFKKKCINNSRGFSLVEVLIACAIISLTSIALMSSISKGVELSNRALRQVQASNLTEEGVEAIKSIRDNNWSTISSLSLNTVYYLSFDSNINSWSLGLTPVGDIDGIFSRKVTFFEVNRDSNDDIAPVGTLDTGIKKVNVDVSWSTQSGLNTKSLSFYLANIFN